MPIRRKLTIIFSAIIVGGLLLLIFFLNYLVQDYLTQLHMDNLRRNATALEQVLRYLPQDHFPRSLDSLATSLRHSLRVRVTFLSGRGRVLADSDVDFTQLDTVENHLQRPEIQEARRGGWGSEQRVSRTVGQPFLYVAVNPPQPIRGVAFLRLAMPMQSVNKTMAGLRTLILIGGLVILLLTVFVTWLMARGLSNPLRRIIRAAHAIEEGDYSTRVKYSGSDEIGQLAEAFNQMSEKIEHDVRRMRTLERMRTEFIGNTSHELKTPIASIKGYLETLLAGGLEDSKVNRKFLERARHNADRLQLLVQDLIQISRIESGEMRMSIRFFDVLELFRDAFNDFKAQFEEKNLEFRLDAPAQGEIRVRGDRERLKQVLNNLLTNALKYTDDGQVVLGLENRRSWVEIYVEDTGSGIPAEYQSRIFERFFRVDRDRSRTVGGTGLGLAIVKHILSAHDTEIHVTSDGHSGSRFWFRLQK